MEWAYRLAQDPRAYWRRYLRTNSWFAWQVLKAKRRGSGANRDDPGCPGGRKMGR
jgi:UDP-N-acetyl-D-mannosaminuronic acid transferase (WecB/TagA/CpsF family)